MLRLVGPLLLAIAGLHVIAAFVLFGAGLGEIASAGLLTGAEWTADMKAAFWFLQFAWPVALLGVLCMGALRTTGDIPHNKLLGGVMALSSLISVALVPVSGFWLLLGPAALLMFAKPGA